MSLLAALHAAARAGQPYSWQAQLPAVCAESDTVYHLPRPALDFIAAQGGKLQRHEIQLQSAPPILWYRACWPRSWPQSERGWIDIPHQS